MIEQIKYCAGYKYQLEEDYSTQVDIQPPAFIKTEYIRLDVDGTLWLVEGYAWDGPSGPTIDTPDSLRGSLIHDALYQLMRLKLLPLSDREAADKELLKACLTDGMTPLRAHLWYAAVRDFAESAATGNPYPVLTAP